MKNNVKNSISKISLFAGLAVISVILAYNYFSTKEGSSSKKIDFYSQLSQVEEQLVVRWQEGDIEQILGTEQLQCPELQKITENFSQEALECNRFYLECYLKKYPLKSDGLSFNLKSLQYVQNSILKVELEEENYNKRVSFFLNSNCHELSLEKKIYSEGSKINKYVWDNFTQDIFIDRFYISYFDLKEADFKLQKKYFAKYYMGKSLLAPALNLPKKDQKKFCHVMGKKLLKAKYFDAATFYPAPVNFKYKFPWGRDSRSFLNRGDEYQVSKDDCHMAYVKGCQKHFALKEFSDNSVSWMGIYNSLGGHAESFETSFLSKGNIKISSHEVPHNSLWHRLGVRGYWNGEDFGHADFLMSDANTNRNIDADIPEGVAFRCYRSL